MLQVAAMQGMLLVQQKDALNYLLTFLSTTENPPAKQNSCYVHFSYFLLPYTANKSTILVLQLQQFCFTECMSTSEKDSHNLLDY